MRTAVEYASAIMTGMTAQSAERGRRSRLRPAPVYPLGLAFALVAVVYVQADVSVFGVLRTLVVVLGSVLFLQVAFSLVLGVGRGAAATAVLILLVRLGDTPYSAILLALLILLTIVAGRYAARVFHRTVRLRPVTNALNVLAGMLVLVIAVQGLTSGRIQKIWNDIPEGRPLGVLPLAAPGDSGQAAAAPDIYILYLEDYPRPDMLLRRAGLDDSAFVTALEHRGFVVSANAHADYTYTDANLASLLQMSLVQASQGTLSLGSRTFRTEINHNPAYADLRERGYQVIANLVRWEDVSQRSADFICGDDISNDLEGTLLSSSALRWLLPGFLAARGRLGAERGFDCALEAVDRSPSGPKLVFSHLAATHLPVLFREDGSVAENDVRGARSSEIAADEATWKVAYAEQVSYENGRALEIIDKILSTERRPPIILVMSDEGLSTAINWSGDEPDLAARYGIIFAALTPNHLGLFGDAPTPPNVFPELLSAYFDEDRSLSPDRFFAVDLTDPTGFAQIPTPSGLR